MTEPTAWSLCLTKVLIKYNHKVNVSQIGSVACIVLLDVGWMPLMRESLNSEMSIDISLNCSYVLLIISYYFIQCMKKLNMYKQRVIE